MPKILLPPEFADVISTTSNVLGAAASFVKGSRRADVFVGVRMSSPLSYRNLDTIHLVFYPPPAIYPATNTISVERGKTDTLTIKVSQRFRFGET